MFKFDVRYTIENYFEYYKFILIKQRIFRDLFFSIVFIGVAIYWWVDTTDQTASEFLPWFAIAMAIIAPIMNFVSLPALKKQLLARENEIKNTHIVITFNEEDVIYDNQTVKPVVETKPVEEEKKNEDFSVDTSVADNAVAEPKEEEKPQESKIFTLHYNNFLSVNETENLFLFSLDRQTIVIIPKSTIEEGTIDSFKGFILNKVLNKRVHFLKKK